MRSCSEERIRPASWRTRRIPVPATDGIGGAAARLERSGLDGPGEWAGRPGAPVVHVRCARTTGGPADGSNQSELPPWR
ncbi:hypothetical protein B7486_69900 [cyanobacterium TDX16]|nr:hypothetical protein B7486_69900 [cyanobacterium TDX16]